MERAHTLGGPAVDTRMARPVALGLRGWEAIAMRSERNGDLRWGRLPRRVTDRVEDAVAWVLLAAGLLLIVIAGATGLGVHGRESERAELESDSRWQARAVLLEDAQLVAGDVSERLPFRAVAHWTDRNGLDHSDVVDVGAGNRPGRRSTCGWTRQGRPRPLLCAR